MRRHASRGVSKGAFNAFCLIGGAILFAGCTSTVTIDSQPQGARLSVDGTPVGVTPYTMEVDSLRVEPLRVRWELEGYESAYFAIGQQPNGGSITTTNQLQLTQTNVSTYGTARPRPYGGASYNANAYGTGTTYTSGVTTTSATYSWPRYISMPLVKKNDAPVAAAATQASAPGGEHAAPSSSVPPQPLPMSTSTATDATGKAVPASHEKLPAASTPAAQRYCTTCGALLSTASVRFCGSCGAKQ